MATKKELEEQVVSLKEMLKKVNEELKTRLNDVEPELGDRPHKALGLFKDGKNYKLVTIDYNPENNACKVVSMEDASRVPEAAHMAKHNLEEAVEEQIIKRLEEDYA